MKRLKEKIRVLSDTELDVVVSEAYAMYDLLRRFLFTPDELHTIFAWVPNATPPAWYVIVNVKRNGLECNFHLYPMKKKDGPRFQYAWLAFIARLPTLPEEELRRRIDGSITSKREHEILTTLLLKGFDLAIGKEPLGGSVN